MAEDNKLLWLGVIGVGLFLYLRNSSSPEAPVNSETVNGGGTIANTGVGNQQLVQNSETNAIAELNAKVIGDVNVIGGKANKHVWWYHLKELAGKGGDNTIPIPAGLDVFGDADLLSAADVVLALR